jgi:hypothetical protein
MFCCFPQNCPLEWQMDHVDGSMDEWLDRWMQMDHGWMDGRMMDAWMDTMGRLGISLEWQMDHGWFGG